MKKNNNKKDFKKSSKNKDVDQRKPLRSGGRIIKIPSGSNTVDPRVTTVSMAECTLKYAHAIADPFSAEARNACVPVGNGSTMKTTNFLRLDGIGSTFGALVYICPTVASDIPYAYYTDDTWPGTTKTPFLTSGSAVLLSTLNVGWKAALLPGSFGAFQCINNVSSSNLVPATNSVTGKLVSAGVRVYYTGAELSLGGTVYCYHDPAHSSVANISGSNIGGYADAVVESVMRDPCTLGLYAVNQTELSFQESNEVSAGNSVEALYPFSSNTNHWYVGASTLTTSTFSNVTNSLFAAGANPRIGSPVGVIYITPQQLTGAFHLDLISHNEYQGAGAAPMLTPNGSDIEGVLKVQAAAQMIPSIKNDNPSVKRSAWDYMKRAMGTVWTMAKPMIVPIVTKLIGM